MPSMVWPMDGGVVRGQTLVPLFNGVTKVATRDAQLHQLLAVVDILRVGTSSQRAVAADHLAHRLFAG
jgi:hypothetical protein